MSPVPAPPLVLAHRGARTVAPENTIEAFTVAVVLGADGVELDVRRTVDGRLVVHHDAEAEGLGVLAERSLHEIRSARPTIPTLEEVLDACAGVLVNVEIKNLPTDADYDEDEGAAELVVALLAERGDRDDVLVSSFNLATIDRVRALDASIATGFLTMLDPLAGIELCGSRGHGAVHPFLGLLGEDAIGAVVERARDAGVRINVWTVNGEADMARFATAGVDAIITDVPDVARLVLATL